MASQAPPANPGSVARQVREQFVAYIEGVLPPLSDAIRLKLIELADVPASTKDMQNRRDAMLDFERARGRWIEGTAKAWRNAIIPPTATASVRLSAMSLELIGDEVVENKILSSRLALAVREKASWELGDLKVRMQHLEGAQELASHDILQPEAVAQLLIEQWIANAFARQGWILAKDVIQQHIVERLLEGYRRSNKFLIANGVLPEIDLSQQVKRGPAARGSGRKGPGGSGEPGGYSDSAQTGMGGPGGYGSSQYSSSTGSEQGGGSFGGGGSSGRGSAGGGSASSGGLGAGGGGPAGGGQGGNGQSGAGQSGPATGPNTRGGSSGEPGATRPGGNVGDETRMMTSATPLARARQRANGVLGQLRRLLTDRVAGFDINHETRPSPALDEALSIHQAAVQITAAASLSGAAGGGRRRRRRQRRNRRLRRSAGRAGCNRIAPAHRRPEEKGGHVDREGDHRNRRLDVPEHPRRRTDSTRGPGLVCAAADAGAAGCDCRA